MENLTKDKSNLIKMLGVLAILACVYLVVITISEIKSYKFIGGGTPASSVVSFDGKGEVFAKPDLATISFTIRDSQKEITTAQTKVTEKETAVLAFLEKSGIEKKDIKTEGYNSYPKYDSGVPCYGYGAEIMMLKPGVPCRPSEPKIIGYEVSEYVSVKVRDLTKAGEIIKGIGSVGISEISGPNFSIENEEELKAQARKMAIDEAKKKAEILARDLGVRLVRIVNFSENGNYPMPMYAKGGMMDSAMAVNAPATPSPELPAGENKIISNVVITYEIR